MAFSLRGVHLLDIVATRMKFKAFYHIYDQPSSFAYLSLGIGVAVSSISLIIITGRSLFYVHFSAAFLGSCHYQQS
jgi:hypothetical protein